MSLNGMGVMRQTWSEHKQAVYHEAFCRSTNWSYEQQCDKYLSLFSCVLLIRTRNYQSRIGTLASSLTRLSPFGRKCFWSAGHFYHIRDLCCICKHVSLDSAKSMATALVGNQLDYCNAFSSGHPKKDIRRLHGVQICLAWVVSGNLSWPLIFPFSILSITCL